MIHFICRFALCTIFEMPHEKSVNTILFSPQSPDSPLKESFPLTITTSDDKKIKFWKLSENSDQGNSSVLFVVNMK